MPNIKLRRLHDSAILPTHDEGNVDLYASVDAKIPPCGTAMISTGWELADEPIISGSCIHGNLRTLMKIEGRSGLASRGIWPVGGIIDPSYRGEIKVILYNSTAVTYYIAKSDRIAQFVWYPVVTSWEMWSKRVTFVETDHVNKTMRGEKGFGSSGN